MGPFRRDMSLLALAMATYACGSSDEAEQLVGSNHVVERETAALVVGVLRVRMPFEATVANGAPGRIILRGEDNLLDQIQVEEVEASRWSIHAPVDLQVTQHMPVEIEVPFVDMVEVTYEDRVHVLARPGAAAPARECEAQSGECDLNHQPVE
jgi:hypothetical protein